MLGEDIISMLLFDNTTQKNIIVDNNTELKIEDVQKIITRNEKEKIDKKSRTKDKAEVFTPSWVCNKQNNLIDTAWFGRENVFNVQDNKTWKTTKDKICFTDKTWQEYVGANRLEIACGEAPYLVSRYDTVTGEAISIQDRIGLLDRKIRIVSENTLTEKEWLHWVEIAYKSIYGFEFSGDNLFLARKNLLLSFIEHLGYNWDREPTKEEMSNIANIIRWNIWQMDGLSLKIPYTAIKNVKKKSYIGGISCKIMDWDKGKEIFFEELMRNEI